MCNSIGGDWTDIHEIMNLDKSYLFKKIILKLGKTEMTECYIHKTKCCKD